MSGLHHYDVEAVSHIAPFGPINFLLGYWLYGNGLYGIGI